MSKKLTGTEITDEVIKGWKEKYGSIFLYKASDGKIAYLRCPERSEIEAANAVSTSKPITSNSILAKACFLGGDEEILNVDKYFYGLSEHLKGIIKKVEGELTEL